MQFQKHVESSEGVVALATIGKFEISNRVLIILHARVAVQ
jgi:hypothetical protein